MMHGTFKELTFKVGRQFDTHELMRRHLSAPRGGMECTMNKIQNLLPRRDSDR